MAITMCLFLGVQFIYVDQVFPFWLVLYIYCYFLGSTTFTLALKNQYNTPLTRAIFNGNADIAKLLLLHDALEDHPATSGNTPFLTACARSRKNSRYFDSKRPSSLGPWAQQNLYTYVIRAICCSRPARWRAKKDSLSLICFLFLMLLLPCSFLIFQNLVLAKSFNNSNTVYVKAQ